MHRRCAVDASLTYLRPPLKKHTLALLSGSCIEVYGITDSDHRKLAERSYRPFVWPARYPKNMAGYEGLLAPQLVEDIEQGVEVGTPTDERLIKGLGRH